MSGPGMELQAFNRKAQLSQNWMDSPIWHIWRMD